MQVTQKPSLHASWIDPFAKEIVERLQKTGFITYLVGGCVRDLLAGIHPKDFDIATSAHPNEVRKKVYGSYIIGRRFRLVLVKRGDQQYEVATFRRESTPEDFENLEAGEDIPKGDNFFGTPEQDALRRDFTINALFYDPVKNELIDYAQGLTDIENSTLRMIGDPAKRIEEDPIRSLRAIRLAHKLHFRIEESLRSAIQENAGVLAKSLMPRRREEYLKFLRLPEPGPALLELYDLGLMKVLLPTLNELFEDRERLEIFNHYLLNWQDLVRDPADPVEIYSAFLWAFASSLGGTKTLEEKADRLMKDELGVFKAEGMAIQNVFSLQKNLLDLDGFLKRGQRRRESFLRTPELPLAIRFSQLDCLLPLKAHSFWQTVSQQ